MRVSPTGQARALDIADLVVREIERQRFRIGFAKDGVAGVWVSTQSREIELIIREEMKRFIHEPTEEEEAKAKNSSWWEPPKYDWRPTGNIFVVYEAKFEPTVIVKEGARWKQENRIPHIVDSLRTMEERAKQHDAELKRWHKEYEENQRRLAREAEEREREKKREAGLLAAMTAWRNAQSIRAFVSAAQARNGEGSLTSDIEGEDFDGWVKWALGYADRIDPLAPTLETLEIDGCSATKDSSSQGPTTP
jgi:hypothetical protein